MNEIDKVTYKEDGGAKRRYMEMERKNKKISSYCGHVEDDTL